MLNFLARLMGLVVMGIFFLALGFFIFSSYLGFDFSEKFELEKASSTALANTRMLKAEKLTENEFQEFVKMNQAQELETIAQASDLMINSNLENQLVVAPAKSDYEVLNNLSLSQLANFIKTGETVLVLLDNSVLDSPMYNSKEVVMTEVLSVDGKVVETSEYGMYINSRYIYPINDFVEAFMAGGQVAVKL